MWIEFYDDKIIRKTNRKTSLPALQQTDWFRLGL